ncbi:unnamed protein product [Cyprideis torosa]|uniref:Uncharacterized protein n=1 Tax=Cyprideis torosa TaxID=163714 RepID=A0A7R8ZPW3_9CRUS|nr:unnamed protein product [Cyprideis torosa]CAG0889228.1 unnamed protein product [Cyprideis torosa]
MKSPLISSSENDQSFPINRNATSLQSDADLKRDNSMSSEHHQTSIVQKPLFCGSGMDQIHRSNGQAANQNGLSRDRHRSLPFVDDPSDCLKKRRISSAPGKAVVEEDPVSQKPLPSPGNEESFRGRRSSSSLGPDCKGRRSCSTSPQMVPGGFSCDASCKREADDSGAVLSEDDVELPLELEWKEDEEEEEDEELLGDEEQINQKIRALINANKISTAGEIPEDKFKFVRQTDGKPLFLCLTCPYHTNRRSNLKRHLLIHSGEKPFKCPLCQNGFRSTGNLRDHLKAHHNESKDEKEKRQSHSKHHTVAFFCRECGSRFSSLLELETHLDVHRGQEISPSKDVERKIWGVKVFLCNYCSYRTERTSNLKRHMRTHFASGQLDSSTSSTASAGSFSSSSKTPTPPPGASPSPGATRSVSEPPHSISPILSTSSPVSPQTPFSTPLGPIRNRSCSATAGTCASFTRKRTRPLSKCSFSPSPSPSPILVKIKAEDIVAFIASSPLVAPAPAVPSPTPDQARDQGGRGKDASANTHVKAETGGSKDLSVPQKAVVASLPIPQVVAPTHWKRRLFRVTGGVCSAPASPLSPAEDGTISPPLRPRRPDSMPCPLTERRTDACHLPSNHTSSAFRSVDRDTEQHQASSSTGTSPLPILSMISPPQTEPMALVVTPRPIASEAASTPASPAMLTSTDSVSSLRRARKKRDPPQEQQTQPQPPVKRREEALCRDPNPFFCPYCVEARKTRAARITHIAVCHPTKKQIVEDLMICSQETEHQRCTKEDLDALYLSSSHGNRINLGGGSNTYLGSAGVTSGLLNPRLPTQAEKDRKNDSLNNLLLRIKSGTTAGHPSAFVPVPPSSSACVSRISQNEEMFQKLVEQMSEDIAAKKRRQHQSPGGGGLASPSPPAPGPLCPERPEHRMTMRRGSDNTDTIRSAAALLELGNISVQRRASVSVPVKRPTATVRPVPVSRAAGGGDHGATRHKDVVSLTSTGSCKADVVESIFAPSTELVVGKEEDGSKRKGKQSSRFRTFAGDLVHLNPLPYECPVCSVFFPSLTMLRMHSQRVHASDTEDSEAVDMSSSADKFKCKDDEADEDSPERDDDPSRSKQDGSRSKKRDQSSSRRDRSRGQAAEGEEEMAVDKKRLVSWWRPQAVERRRFSSRDVDDDVVEDPCPFLRIIDLIGTWFSLGLTFALFLVFVNEAYYGCPMEDTTHRIKSEPNSTDGLNSTLRPLDNATSVQTSLTVSHPQMGLCDFGIIASAVSALCVLIFVLMIPSTIYRWLEFYALAFFANFSMFILLTVIFFYNYYGHQYPVVALASCTSDLIPFLIFYVLAALEIALAICRHDSDPLTITLKVPDEEEEEGETQSKRRRHSRDLSGSSLSTTVSEGTTDLERALRNSVSGTAISVEVVRRPPSVPRCPSSKSPINAEAATIATVNCDKCKEPVRATVSDLLLHRPVCDANQRKGKQGPPTSATGSSVLLSALQRALTKKEADNDNCDSPAPVDFSQPLSCPICPTGVPHTHITPASVLEEEDSQRASDPEQLLRQQRRKGLPKRTSSRGSMDVDESPGSPVLLDLSRKERVTPPADSKEQRLLLLEHVLKRQQESGGCSDDSPALISEVKGQEQSCVFCLLPFPTASLGDHIRVAHTRFDASKRREERQTQSLQQEAARRKREAGGSTGSTSPAPSDVDGWYNCPFCDFSSPSKAELYLHVTEHLFCGNSGYRCPFCSQEESNRFVFAQHVSCHIGLDKPSVYKCPFCDFICQTRELLASHKQRHVFEVFKCEDCPFVTSSRYQLTRHTRNQHPWVKAHRCDQCSFRSHDAQTLRNHMYLHRLPNTQNISIEAVGSGHVCEFCSQLFLTTKTLAHHVKYDCRSKGGASGGSSEPPEKPVVEEDGEITPDFEKERIQRLVDGKPVFEKLMKKKIWLATTSSDGQSSATTSSVSVGGPSTGLSTTPVIPRVLNEQDLEEVEAALSRPKKVSKKEVSKQLSRAAKEILKKKTQVEEEQAAQLLLAMRGGLNPAVRSSTTANTGSTGEAGAVPIGASTSTSSILKKVLIKNPDDLAETANEGQGKEDDGTQKGVSGLKDERLWLTLPPPQDDTTREGSSPEADEAGILLSFHLQPIFFFFFCGVVFFAMLHCLFPLTVRYRAPSNFMNAGLEFQLSVSH